MKKNALITLIIGVLFIAFAVGYYFTHQSKPKEEIQQIEYIHNEGETQGTTYSATYQQPDGLNLQEKIENKLHEFDLSLSSYIPNSVISRINKNDTSVKTDVYFETMFYAAQDAAQRTNGAIDITVGPLVKAWGFAFGNKSHVKLPNIKDYLPYIGYSKIQIKDHKLIKQDPRILIDDNSIAQGYSADIIGKLLEDNGCKNYMIEIGGEVVCKGLNSRSEKWSIGIDKAIDDSTNTVEELQTIIHITNCAVTTAGGYRKFFIKDGKKYSHIINPHTGFPIDNNMLSATVIAPTGIMADAYDTPFMVIGVDSCLKVCKRIPGLECYLIYLDKKGKPQVVYTEGFKKYLSK